jgi:hypothetical protein
VVPTVLTVVPILFLVVHQNGFSKCSRSIGVPPPPKNGVLLGICY